MNHSIHDARVTTLASARTLAELDALYVQWIGYSIVADDPSATPDKVRTILYDWIVAEDQARDERGYGEDSDDYAIVPAEVLCERVASSEPLTPACIAEIQLRLMRDKRQFATLEQISILITNSAFRD